MPNFYPKIMFPTDGNEAKLVEVLTHDGRVKMKEEIAVYSYVKSITKMGMELKISQSQFDNFVRNGILIEI